MSFFIISLNMNWRKESAEQNRRINRATGIMFYVIGAVIICRASYMWLHDLNIISISATKLAPLVHTPVIDLLFGLATIMAGWGTSRNKETR